MINFSLNFHTAYRKINSPYGRTCFAINLVCFSLDHYKKNGIIHPANNVISNCNFKYQKTCFIDLQIHISTILISKGRQSKSQQRITTIVHICLLKPKGIIKPNPCQ